MKTYLKEAFQQMELIESNSFTFDNKGATELANFMEGDMLNDFEAIIDPEAETVEELKDSYIGDVVCQCQICKSKIYKKPEEIIIEPDAEFANIGECCPYCFETDGYKILGQIAPYEQVSVESAEPVKVEVDGEIVDTEDDAEPVGRHTRDNEDLEDSQRFPVEGTKQVDLTENKSKSKRHARDNEDLEDSQRYPIESPVGTKGLKEGVAEDADVEEGFDLHLAKGTVAKAIYDRKPEIDACGDDIEACKRVLKGILLSDAVSELNKPEADKILRALDKIKSPAHFWSSFATWMGAPKVVGRHTKDNEDLEDSQRYPIESPVPAQTGLAMMESKVSEGLSNREKLKRAFPELNLDGGRKSPTRSQDELHESTNENFETEVGSKAWTDKVISFYKEAAKKLGLEDLKMSEKSRKALFSGKKGGKEYTGSLDMEDSHINNVQEAEEAIKFALADAFNESLTEGMEDISITTDDQVIKVKSTPRADKEAIQPITDETKDIIESEPVEETESTDDTVISDDTVVNDEEDVEIEDFDETAFDELSEGYLKKVYENVDSYKTTNGFIRDNKLILEGVIKFNSGKSAKTSFVFESKNITKSGKVRFRGLNEHISTNKNSFTLTGTVTDKKLLSESLNYNYGARSDEGKMKRLYGTIKRNVK